MNNNTILITIITLLIGGGLGFYAGMKYQQSQRSTLAGQFGNRQFLMRNGQRVNVGNNRGSFRPVNGEVISTDEKSITVKLQDGSSKIVLLSDKTEINKAEKVERSELKEGVKVAVFGIENKDGSVSAQNIQLNPVFRILNNQNN